MKRFLSHVNYTPLGSEGQGGEEGQLLNPPPPAGGWRISFLGWMRGGGGIQMSNF